MDIQVVNNTRNGRPDHPCLLPSILRASPNSKTDCIGGLFRQLGGSSWPCALRTARNDNHTPARTPLVRTLERRYRLALGRVQGAVLHASVVQVDLAVRILLPCEGVLHPVVVITLREVLASVRAARLLAVSGRNGGLGPGDSSAAAHVMFYHPIRTRMSTNYGAPGSRSDPSSRSCCGPSCPLGRTSGRSP
jgi:hypothetical protein